MTIHQNKDETTPASRISVSIASDEVQPPNEKSGVSSHHHQTSQALNDFLQKHVLKKRRLTSKDWFSASESSINTNFDDLSPENIFSNDNCKEGNPATSALNSIPSNTPHVLPFDHLERKSQSFNSSRINEKLPCNPTALDVLLGRGGSTNTHPGNIRYREEVEKIRNWYSSCTTKTEKKEISQLLVEYVHDYGGRFLVKDDLTQQWVIADSNVARKKASQALRDAQKWKSNDNFEFTKEKPHDPGG